jgi:membrane protease YdiL (CAAX protease family)
MMKKHLFVFGKSICFLALWASIISLLVIPTIHEPPFIKKEAVFLRFWWELLPLLAVIIVTVVFIKFFTKNKYLYKGDFNRIIKNLITGIIFGITWIGITIIIAFLAGSFHWGNFNHIPYLFIWIISIFINAAMQEYLVRGYLFKLLKIEYSTIVAVIATTVLFTLLHGGAFEAGIITVLNIITMSVFMSLLLLYTNNLITSIIAHGLWNIIGALLGCISLASDYPILVNCTLTGNEIISGGKYKLEGSIIVLVINMINIVLLIVFMAKNKKSQSRQ